MTPRWRAALAAFLAGSGLLALAGCAGGGGPGGTAATAATAGSAASPLDGPLRSTPWGRVQGRDDRSADGTWSWQGLPFARPPVGEQRWRPPADPAPWPGVRAAQAFAPACQQTSRLYGPGAHNRYDASIGRTLGQPVGDEDCLYLNIWQPATPAAKPRPVIVWVYGGSNVSGYTADPVYHGARLAVTADAVVVSVNYRLGIFGFLDLPALKTGDADGDSGNFALLDIAQALAVVQRSIAAFGGDPGNVTLMGESAGAVNVYALLTSPRLLGRAPLFHRLIALSGGISTPATLPPGAVAVVQPRRVTQARAEGLLLESLVVAGQAADVAQARQRVAEQPAAQAAAWLRAQPAATLLDTVRTRLAPRGLAAAGVVADGHVVASDPIAAIRAGRYQRVPVLAGITRDEGRLFPSVLARPDLGGVNGRLLSDAQVFALAHGYQPDGPPTTRVEDWIPPAYLPVDAPGTGFIARSERLTAIWFTALRDDVLQALRSRQDAVWCYRFDWNQLPPPFDTVYGAAHAFDLPFVFGNFGPSLYAGISFTRANAPGRLALSRAMGESLGAFARSGSPDHAALGRPWPRWPGLMVFDAGPEALRLSTDRATPGAHAPNP